MSASNAVGRDRSASPQRGIPGVRSVFHIGLTVPDLNQAITFFIDVIGSDLLWRDGPLRDETGTWMTDHLGVHPRATVHLAMVRCGPTMNVELLQYDGDPDASKTPARNSDVSGRHLAFYVDDVDRAADYLRAQPGVNVLAGPVLNDAGPTKGMKFIYATTPWGLSIELDEVPAHMPYEASTPYRVAAPAAAWRDAAAISDTPPAIDPVEEADLESFPASDPPARGGVGPA